jgi:hypothetical protein
MNLKQLEISLKRFFLHNSWSTSFAASTASLDLATMPAQTELMKSLLAKTKAATAEPT